MTQFIDRIPALCSVMQQEQILESSPFQVRSFHLGIKSGYRTLEHASLVHVFVVFMHLHRQTVESSTKKSSHHPITLRGNPHRWSQRSVNPLRNLVGGCSPTPLKNHGLRTSWDYNIPNCFWKVSPNSMASNHQPDCFWGVLSMAEGIHQNPSMVPFFGPGVPRPTQTPHAGCEP